MGSVRKYKNIKVLNMENSISVLKRITEFPAYSLGLAHRLKGDVLMSKSIFIGSTLLDLSKKVMYEFFYDYVKPKWGDKAKLLFTDRDSFCLEIETEDVYKDISNDVDEWFDTSNYPKDNQIKAGVKTGHFIKMVPGKMKDELAGKQVQQFCGLSAKTYSFENGERKAKGVNRAAKNKYLTHEDYVKVLNEETNREIECIEIGSKKSV